MLNPKFNILQRVLGVFQGELGLKSIFNNIGWLLVDKFFRMFISLLVGFWVARFLGPEQFGDISYAQNFIVILSAVSGLGLDAIVLRELSRRENDSFIILGSAFVLKLIGALFVFLGLLAFVELGGVKEGSESLVIVISLAMFFQGVGLVEVYFQSLVKSMYVVFFGFIAVLLSSAVKVFLILIEADLYLFAVSYFFDVLVHAAAMFLCYRLVVGKSIFLWVCKLGEALSLVKDSWPLMIAGLSFVVFYSFDFLMIQSVFGGYESGIYAAAFKFCVILHFVPGVVINSFKPSVVRLVGSPDYEKRIEFVTGGLLWFAIFMCVATWLGADILVVAAYGSEYAEAADLLRMMMLSNVFVFFFSCWNSWNIIEGKSRRVMVSNILATFIKLFFAFFFLKDFGLQGLVVLGMLAVCLSFLLLSLGDRKTFKLAVSAFLLPFRWLYVKN